MAEKLHEQSFGWHANLPDVPGKSAAEMKAFFDAPHHLFLERINELIDEIEIIGRTTSDLEERAEQFQDLKWRVDDIEEAIPGEPIQEMYPTVYAVVKYIDKTHRTIRGLINKNTESVEDNAAALDSLRSDAANAVRGAVTGSVLSVNDISPLTHPMKLQIASKNKISYPYIGGTETINGITFTDNGDGTITVSGTATTDAIFNLNDNTNPIKATGETVTVSGCPAGGSTSTYFLFVYDGTNGAVDSGNKLTFAPKGDITVSIRIKAGTRVENLVFRPQIESGTTATDFTQYVGDLSAVNVSRCGKNLLPINEMNDLSKDLVIWEGRLSGTFSFSADFSEFKTTTEAQMTADAFCFTFEDGSYVAVSPNIGKRTFSGTLKQIKYYNNVNPSGKIKDMQLEWGTAPTEFEPYTVETTTATANGTVDGIKSISPNMTLIADNNGVVLDMEYNRDLNKVIENITQAIISLGGNV